MKETVLRRLLAVSRIGLAAALFFLALRRIEWHDTIATDSAGRILVQRGTMNLLRAVKPVRPAAAAGCILLASFLIAARWRTLLAVQKVQLGMGRALRLILTAAAFNTILPGSVGGDLVRAWYICRDQSAKAGVLASIVFDRFVGMAGLLIWATGTLAAISSSPTLSGGEFRSLAISVAALWAFCLATVLFVLIRHTSPARLTHGSNAWILLQLLGRAWDSLTLYRRAPRALVRALYFSLGCQGLTILAVMLLGSALGLPLRPCWYFSRVPIIIFLSAIPLTPGSIGVTEQLYLLYFAPAAGENGAFSLALLSRVVELVPGLVGTVLYAFGSRAHRSAQTHLETRD
ncbi:MAG: lysylphosphatidylglycerol synthase transmembrane domain-containing protein [Kiritimatiellia bacterium]